MYAYQKRQIDFSGKEDEQAEFLRLCYLYSPHACENTIKAAKDVVVFGASISTAIKRNGSTKAKIKAVIVATQRYFVRNTGKRYRPVL